MQGSIQKNSHRFSSPLRSFFSIVYLAYKGRDDFQATKTMFDFLGMGGIKSQRANDQGHVVVFGDGEDGVFGALPDGLADCC